MGLARWFQRALPTHGDPFLGVHACKVQTLPHGTSVPGSRAWRLKARRSAADTYLSFAKHRDVRQLTALILAVDQYCWRFRLGGREYILLSHHSNVSY